MLFVRSVAGFLFLTAAAKMLSLQGALSILSAQNPLFWYLNNRQVLFVATTLEFATVATILLSGNRVFRLGIMLWLGVLFLIYRVGLWWIHANTPCLCLGNIAGWMGLSPIEADTISKVVLAYQVGGSAGLLIAMLCRRGAKGTRAKRRP